MAHPGGHGEAPEPPPAGPCRSHGVPTARAAPREPQGPRRGPWMRDPQRGTRSRWNTARSSVGSVPSLPPTEEMTRTIQSLIRLRDLSESRLEDILDLAQRFKAGSQRAELAGKSVGFLFFRGSLRTRTSFEVAVQQLGGRGVHLSAGSDFWELEARDGVVMDGTAPEHVRDAAAVMSTYCDALAIRPKPAGKAWEVDRRDEGIRAWASNSQVPVINMESALWHPLQVLADLLTLRETFGKDIKGRRRVGPRCTGSSVCGTRHSTSRAAPSSWASLRACALPQTRVSSSAPATPATSRYRR